MKSILYVGCDIPDGNAAAIRVFSNSLALKQYGYKVFILSLDHDYKDNESVISECNGCSVIHYPYPKSKVAFLKHLFSIAPYRKTIDEILEDENLVAVIVYDQPAISFLKLMSYCHKKGIKMICDCAEWHTSIHLKGIARVVKSIDTGLAMYYAYRKSDGIIAISRFLEKYFLNNGNNKNVVRIPPLQYEKKSRDVFDVNKQRVFIYAGVAGRDKDCLDVILRAFSEIKTPFTVKLFGLTEDECTSVWPETQEYIEKARVRSNILFYGKHKHSIILEETAKSDYCVIIRDNTRKNNAGFPTKFAESIECGTPVIANDFSDVCDYIKKYELGICITEERSLSDVLEQAILKNDAEIEQLKKNCYLSNMFNYSSYIKTIGNFVDGLLTEK